VPYNAVGDFTPIVKIGINRRVIVVNPDLPIRNLRDLIDYSKKNQGKLSCGVAAAGSAQELAGDILKAETGMDFVSVPFRGGANAVQGLLSGDIGMAILILGDVVELVRAGKLRAVAIVDGDRAKIAPDVPSLAESGITMVPEQWVGLLGPRGLPETVTASLNASVNKTLAEPQVRRSLETLGYDIVGGTPEAFGTQMKDNVELYRKLTDKLGIKPK
jgi:tripartite-type tricarboxylate transporter receptor subunit TctC